MPERELKLPPSASSDAEAPLRVGLVAESETELLQLKQLMYASSYHIAFTATAASEPELAPDVDVWVLRVTQASAEMDDIVASLVLEDVPVVIDDASEAQEGRSTEYYTSKVESAYVMHSMQSKHDVYARDVWVLAASAGGPEAVIAFLSKFASIGGNEKAKLAFVYAQHIDEVGLDNLIRAIQRNTDYQVQRCQSGQLISAGHIYVLSPTAEVDISDSRCFRVTGDIWKGDYAPSISQTIAKVARVYKNRSGALIFSGMGDDGANAVKLMKAMGGEIFTQSSSSCAVDSMPSEAEATGCVDFSGSPDELATKLLTRMQVAIY